MTTNTLLEHFTLLNDGHFNIIEFAPDILEMVFNKCKVMATLSTAIMNTDCVQVVWVVAQVFEYLTNIVVFCCDLRFK